MTGLALVVHAVLILAVTATVAILVGDAVSEWRNLQAERLQRVRVPARRRPERRGAGTGHAA